MYKQYKDPDGTVNQYAVIRTIDNACIPFSEDNTDYQAYLKWLEEGNLPHPADFVEPSSESSVSPLPADTMENT